jgi:hypothetical protein
MHGAKRPNVKRFSLLLFLVAPFLGLPAGCGNGAGESPSTPLPNGAAEAAYQNAASAFKEYDTASSLVAAEEAPRDLLHQERLEYHTLLNMCYEWTYRHQNFAPDELREHADQLGEWVVEQSAKRLDILPRHETLMENYREARAGYLEKLGVLAGKLQLLAEHRKQH